MTPPPPRNPCFLTFGGDHGGKLRAMRVGVSDESPRSAKQESNG